MTSLVTVTVSRTFTAGTLAGLTLAVDIARLDARHAGAPGDSYEVPKPVGGSPYIDTVVAVRPYLHDSIRW